MSLLISLLALAGVFFLFKEVRKLKAKAPAPSEPNSPEQPYSRSPVDVAAHAVDKHVQEYHR